MTTRNSPRFNTTAIGLSLSVLAMATAGQALAQEASDTAPAPANEVEEVVVTARKVSENLQTTPVAVSAVSGDMLEKRSLNRLEDLSTVVPNLLLTSSSPAGSGALVYVRGVGSNSSSLYADSPVAVYVDGVLIPHGSALSFDLPDVASVEVLRGPQGTLFGRNTTGGAVNIFTTKPTTEAGGRVTVGYGTDNNIVFKTVLNAGELGESGLRVKATYAHDSVDGFANSPGVSASKSAGFRKADALSIQGNWTLSPTLTADYRFDAAKASQRPYAQFLRMGATPTAYYTASPTFGGAPLLVSPNYLGVEYLDPRLAPNEVTTYGHALTVDWNLSENVAIKSITAYRRMVQHLAPQFTGSAQLLGPVLNPVIPGAASEVVGPFINVGQFGYQRQFSEELQLTGDAGDFSYVVGGYYFTEEIDDALPNDVTFVLSPVSALQIHRKRSYNIVIDSYAAFAQGSWKPASLDEKFEASLGVRYTKDEKKFYEFNTASNGPNTTQRLNNTWSNVSGAVSLSYRWTPTFMTYARVSNGYKAGGYNPGSVQPAYNPEKAVSYEAGFKSDWFDRRLRINVDIFDTEYKNVQVSQFNGATGSSQIVNAAAARYRGAEVEAHAVLGRLQIDGSVGILDPEYLHYYNKNGLGVVVDVASQTKVQGVSKFTANIGAGYSWPATSIGEFSARVDYAYRGEQFAYTLPSTVFSTNLPIERLRELNASLTLADIPTGAESIDLQLELYGKNLLDYNRRIGVTDFGGSLAVTSGYYERGRQVGVRLKATF